MSGLDVSPLLHSSDLYQQDFGPGAEVQRQQAQSLSLQNQLAAINLGVTKQALQDYSGQMGNVQGSTPPDQGAAPSDQGGAAPAAPAGGAPAAAAPQSGADLDPTAISQDMHQRFFVDPMGTPEMQQQIVRASYLKGINPGLLAAAQAQRDQYVKSQTAQNQNMAGQLFDTMQMVATSQHPFTMLSRVAPDKAAEIARAAAAQGATPDQLAQRYASTVAGQAHLYSGRDTITDQAGVTRDKQSGLPIPGVPQAGLSPYALSKVITEMMQPVTTRINGVPAVVPNWRFNGAPGTNPVQAALGMLAKAGMYSPGMPGANQIEAQVRDAVTRAEAANPKAQQIVIPNHPILTKALNDPDYRYHPPVAPPGQSLTPEQQGVEKTYVTQRKDLQDESQDETKAGAQALMYLRIANQVLNSKDSTILTRGPLSGMLQGIVSHIPGFTNTNWVADRVILAKNLANAASQQLKTNTGGTSRPSQFEFKINMEQLNPSPSMPAPATQKLITEMARIATYKVQMARKVPFYLNVAKNDPGSFPDWAENYYPLEKYDPKELLKDYSAPKGSSAAQTETPSGANERWQKYTPAQRDRALAILRAQPGTAPLFKRNYGFLPGQK